MVVRNRQIWCQSAGNNLLWIGQTFAGEVVFGAKLQKTVIFGTPKTAELNWLSIAQGEPDLKK